MVNYEELSKTPVCDRYKVYNENILLILEGLKKDNIIADYRVIEDGLAEQVSTIEILDSNIYDGNPTGIGPKLNEIYRLGYSLSISDEELEYSSDSKCGLKYI